MKALTALLLVLLTTVQAAQIASGDRASVKVRTEGGALPVVFEVATDPDTTGRRELTFFLYRRDSGERSLTRVVTPLEPGRYRLEMPLVAGSWNVSLRYGIGLDFHYGFFRTDIDPEEERDQRHLVDFERELGDGVPGLVQPLGFAVFGALAGVALVLITVILRRLRREESGGGTGG